MEGDRIITVSIRQRFLKDGHVFDLNSNTLVETTTKEQQKIITKAKFKKRNYKNHVRILGEYGSLRWWFWTCINYILWIFSYFWLWYRGDDDSHNNVGNVVELRKNKEGFNSQQHQELTTTTINNKNNNQKLFIKTTELNKQQKRKGGKIGSNKSTAFTLKTTRRRNSSETTTTNSSSWNGIALIGNNQNDYCKQMEEERRTDTVEW